METQITSIKKLAKAVKVAFACARDLTYDLIRVVDEITCSRRVVVRPTILPLQREVKVRAPRWQLQRILIGWVQRMSLRSRIKSISQTGKETCSYKQRASPEALQTSQM